MRRVRPGSAGAWCKRRRRRDARVPACSGAGAPTARASGERNLLMAVSLVLIRNDLSQLEIPVKHSPEVIGRHNDCKIRIPDPSVSRQHCEVSLADGKVMLRDLGSSNGTFVNRKRITQIELAAGDMLAVGKFVFVVRVDGKPMAIDSMEVLEDGAPPAAAAPSKPAKAIAKAGAPSKPAAAKKADPGDSSLTDFDFMDDDLDSQPKL